VKVGCITDVDHEYIIITFAEKSLAFLSCGSTCIHLPGTSYNIITNCLENLLSLSPMKITLMGMHAWTENGGL
jgi:hypothetical protein